MVETAAGLELAIDTAATVASVALASEGALLAELIPAIETVLAQAGCEREQIRVVFVDRGPGAYAGLRVGISTAMGLALALGAELLAAGRLELDAYPHAAFPGPICAVHQAGRGDLAWGVYAGAAAGLEELTAPHLTSFAELLESTPHNALFCGELAGLDAEIRAQLPGARLASPAASLRRGAALAELGWRRYSAGARDNPLSVEAIYLREPAITKSKTAATGTR